MSFLTIPCTKILFIFRSDGPVPPALSIEVSFITDNSNIIKPIPPVILTQAIQH